MPPCCWRSPATAWRRTGSRPRWRRRPSGSISWPSSPASTRWRGARTRARAARAHAGPRADARYVSPYALALVHAALGEARPAIAALERALREGDPAVLQLPLDPRLAALRADPRVTGLVRHLMPDYNPPTSSPRPPSPRL